MFSKFALIAAASMAIVVAAAPAPGGIENSCNTGPVQCCNSLASNESEQANIIASILGVALGPIGTQVGIQCTPLSILGIGKGASCGSQPVCCSNNSFNGLVAVGCSPINLNV